MTAADKRTRPAPVAGTSGEAWRVANTDGTRTEVEKFSFTGVPLTYLQLATVYRDETGTAKTGYNAEFIVTALGSVWTRSSDMPTTGTAVYNGQSYGMAIVSTPRDIYRTTSNFQMTANFATGSVTGSLTGFSFFRFADGTLVATPASVTGLNLNFTAAIAGSGFGNVATGTGLSSARVDGQFAGPAAQEVAGAYQGSGADLLALQGAFVGKK